MSIYTGSVLRHFKPYDRTRLNRSQLAFIKSGSKAIRSGRVINDNYSEMHERSLHQ
jgi:hypothetical protein